MANSVIQKKSIGVRDVEYSAEYTVQANSSVFLTGQDLPISTPIGYAYSTVVSFSTGNSNVFVRNMGFGHPTLQNLSNTVQTGTFAVTVRYIRIE